MNVPRHGTCLFHAFILERSGAAERSAWLHTDRHLNGSARRTERERWETQRARNVASRLLFREQSLSIDLARRSEIIIGGAVVEEEEAKTIATAGNLKIVVHHEGADWNESLGEGSHEVHVYLTAPADTAGPASCHYDYLQVDYADIRSISKRIV